MRPCGSCITCHVYWKALPSVKSLAVLEPWPNANGSYGVRQAPLVSRPRTMPIERSSTFDQLPARLEKKAASSVLPSAAANCAAHQSS